MEHENVQKETWIITVLVKPDTMQPRVSFYYKTGLSFYHKIVDFPHRLSVYYCLVQVTIPSGPLQVKIKQDGGFTQEKTRRPDSQSCPVNVQMLMVICSFEAKTTSISVLQP